MTEPVRGHRSKTVVEAARLHRARERKSTGLTLVEGPQLLRDIAATGARILRVFATEPVDDFETVLVDERALARLAGTKTPRGPVAVVETHADRLDTSRDLLVSVGVSDPGNIGAMVRTAAAFGWGFGHLEGSADPWSPKAIRAGAGGQFQTSVATLDSVKELEPWTTIATVVSGGIPPGEITTSPRALLVGAEATGLPREVVTSADFLLTIPMPGPTESLNAAAAAAIAVYALTDSSGHGDTAV